MLQAPSYLSRADHKWKIRARRQRTDVGKYCFVNRTVADWNRLPEAVVRDYHGKLRILRERVREVLNSEGKRR